MLPSPAGAERPSVLGQGTARGPDSRIDAIDQFRGAAIVLMVLANYLADVGSIPSWLKHAPDIGLTAIGLT